MWLMHGHGAARPRGCLGTEGAGDVPSLHSTQKWRLGHGGEGRQLPKVTPRPSTAPCPGLEVLTVWGWHWDADPWGEGLPATPLGK